MGNNPSQFNDDGDDCPVENVSWDDCSQFIQKLNAKTSNTYRLPSEAEWEYAARAGFTGKWCFGNDEHQLSQYAWYNENSDSYAHPVAQKQANAFGLFDIHGNVWEWVEDVWHNNYSGAPTDGSGWTTDAPQSRRVQRGGSWLDRSGFARTAYRSYNSPGNRYNSCGLRLARTLVTP